MHSLTITLAGRCVYDYIMTVIKTGLFALLIISCLLSCSKSKTLTSIGCSTSVSFAIEVHPVTQSPCTNSSSCHAAGSTKGPGTPISYALFDSAWSRIRSAVTSSTMPDSGSLAAAELSAIVCRINAGASDNWVISIINSYRLAC